MLLQSIALSEQTSNTPLLKPEHLIETYRSAKKRLICFDYDVRTIIDSATAATLDDDYDPHDHQGTLTPIRKTPGAAVPPPDMLEALQALCADPKNDVWIISGRDESALDRWLGHIDGIGLSAEHGCFMKYPRSKKWINLTEHFDMSWKYDVIDIFTYYTERTTGSFIEHKRCSITWHYRMADPEYGAFQAKECHNHLENAVLSKLPVEVLVGKKNLEVRPTSINKGEIIKRLLGSGSGTGTADYDFVMCCGDDKTDEDMFKRLRQCSSIPQDRLFSVMVGAEAKKTMASWRVSSVQDIINTMRAMAHIVDSDK